jgi:hypothetical protein
MATNLALNDNLILQAQKVGCSNGGVGHYLKEETPSGREA